MKEDMLVPPNINAKSSGENVQFVGFSSGSTPITFNLGGLSGTATDTILSYTFNTDEILSVSSGTVHTAKLVVKTASLNYQEWQNLSGEILASINGNGQFTGALASGTIGSGAISSYQLALQSVFSGNISSGQIGANHLASGVLQSSPANLQSGQVTSGYIGVAGVNNLNITSGTISNDKLQNNQISIAGYLASLGGSWSPEALTTSSGLLAGIFYPSGSLTIGIASGGLKSEMFGSGSVLSGSIASGQIGPNHLSSGSIGIGGTNGELQFNNSGTLGATTGINYNISSGSNFLQIQSQSPYNNSVDVKAASGQVSDLQSWSNTSGSALAHIDINGNFYAVSKSFYIDHPSKNGLKLRHASLEGPTADVFYRGKSKSNNFSLPEFWDNFVDKNNIDIILVPIGKHQSLYIEKIENLQVFVGGSDNPYYTFLAIAERIDIPKIVVEE